jgi:nucleotide-binding universal stress UspA family protein
VVGVDGSEGGYAAVTEAAELARSFRARLIGVSVEEGLPRYAATKGEADEFEQEKDRCFAEVGERAARLAGHHGSAIEHVVRIGDAADVPVRFVDEVGADLVVLGTRGTRRS